jgi:transcriptional regulator with XRE-family HTH domain
MSTRGEILHSVVGRRVAKLRKQKGLSQSELASRLARKRTQAWMSTVESGSRNMNTEDLVDVATILEVSVGELFNDLSTSSAGVPKSLREFLSELDTHLPIEMPVYLQRDIGKSTPLPIDYQYASSVPSNKIFNKSHPLAKTGSMSVMVVERYYKFPNLDPTDLITFTGTLVPVPDPDARATDRVLIKLNEPYDGLHVHPGLIKAAGQVETTISGRDPVVFEDHEFEILGVLILRRTLYRASTMRAWIQRQFGITKEERLVE